MNSSKIKSLTLIQLFSLIWQLKTMILGLKIEKNTLLGLKIAI